MICTWYFLFQDNREAFLYLSLSVHVLLFPRSKSLRNTHGSRMRNWRSSSVMNVVRRSSETIPCSATNWSTLVSRSISVQNAARSSHCWNIFNDTSLSTLEKSPTSATSVDVHSPSKEVYKLTAALTLGSNHIHVRFVDEPLHCSRPFSPTWGHTVKRRRSSVTSAKKHSRTETPCPGMSLSTLVCVHFSAMYVVRPSPRPMISSATAVSTLVCVLTNVTFAARLSQWSSPWFVTSAHILVCVLTNVTIVRKRLHSQVPDWSM